MLKVYGNSLNELEYYARTDGSADVYIRKNITAHMELNEDGQEVECGQEADEVHYITTASREEIEANLDKWFEYGERWEPEPTDERILLDRALDKIKELEDVILEMSMEVYGM